MVSPLRHDAFARAAGVPVPVGGLVVGQQFRYQPNGPLHTLAAKLGREYRVRERDNQGRESTVPEETRVILVNPMG